MISASAALTGSYNSGEVARSVLIAIAASYAGLDLAGRVTAASGRVRLAWLSGGAVAMGVGIWATHLKGMLAFHLPVLVEYHWPTVLAALLVAIFASAVALYVTSRQKMGGVEALTGSIVMSAGIAGLHYILMAAMRIPAITQYSAFLVTCSILLAILFSLIALLLAFGLREETRWSVPRRLGSAIVMGAAISFMHYTGMAAASFIPSSAPDLRHTVSVTPVGNSGVVIAALIVLAAAVTTSSVDRRRSEDRLRLVIDTAPAMLYSARPDGYVDFFNKRWLEYVGVSLEDISGWRWTNVIHPEDVEDVVGKWRSSVATGRTFEAEARLRRADGEYRLMLLRKVPLRDETGRIVKWYGSAIDIEARKRAEEELKGSEERHRVIVEAASDAVISMDESGGILLANPATTRIFGHDPVELIGKPLTLLMPEFMRKLHEAGFKRYLATGQRHLNWQGTEVTALRKNGQEFPVEVSFGEMISNRHKVFTGFIRDISEKKRAEDELRKQKEVFQKIFEHLPVMIGFVGADDHIELVNPEWERTMGWMLKEIREQNVDLFAEAYPDPQYRRMVLDFVAASTGEFIDLKVRVKDGRVIDLSGAVVHLSDGTSIAIGQDITERKRSEVELRESEARFRLVAVLLAVSDTGIGMDAATQVHIFEPFYTTKEAGKGTGLGLATVYGIVKQSHGFIWVYSEPDRGSIFKIYLPGVDAAVDSDESLQPVQVPSPGTETIPLVEDEAALRNVCRVYLESKGYTVLEAGNAKEAMKICQSHDRPIQVLITDIVMPGLGGLELAKSALEMRPELSVVLVSGFTDRPLDREAIRFAKFLQKPFSFDALARTVRSLLDKNREILLIEDSKFMRVTVQRALTGAGYTVHTANDGEAGLRAARETLPDLIVLDLVLPTISGPDVLKALKRDVITKSIPVIVLAALSEPTKEELLNEGAAACVEKSDKLFENDSVALIHTVTQVVQKANASSG